MQVTLTLLVACSMQLLCVVLVERGNRVVHCPEGICVLFIYGAERQEVEVCLVECWGGYEMIEDVCPHVCNSLGWVEGLGGGRERIKEQEGIPNGFSIFSSAINSTRTPSCPLCFDVFFLVYTVLQVHFFFTYVEEDRERYVP